MDRREFFRRFPENIALAVGGFTIMLMMFYVVVSTATRLLMDRPLPAVTELVSRWWMVPLVFAGIDVALLREEHIAVDLFVSRMSALSIKICRAMGDAIMLIFLAALIWGGLAGSLEHFRVQETGIDSGLPVWMTRLVVPVGAALGIAVLCKIRMGAAHSTAGAGQSAGPEDARLQPPFELED